MAASEANATAPRSSWGRTLRRSDSTDREISLNFGTSFMSLAYVSSSYSTLFRILSFTFPLDHFFFLPLPPLMAARILASLV